MIKKLATLFLTFVFLFVGVVSYIYFTQESRIFQTSKLAHDHIFSYDQPFEEIYYDVDHNARVHALYFPVENAKGTILYFHGRGDNLATYWGAQAKTFTKRGYNVLMPDYRSFGKSYGPLSQKALLLDAIHIYDDFQNTHPNEEIIVYGRSMGTSIATYVASKRPTKMLLLESPFVSMLDVAPRNAPAFLPSFVVPMILKFPFPTHEWIPEVTSPIHIFHGTNDTIVPYDSSPRLLEFANNATLTTIEDGRHGNLHHHPDYHTKLDSLLASE